MHHDKDFAVERNGTRDIFLNTPNQAAWFERYLTDWTGPHGRLGRMTFRMRDSVFPGDTMVFDGVVQECAPDDTGCGWVTVDVTLAVDGDVKTTCTAPRGGARRRRGQPLVPPRRTVEAMTGTGARPPAWCPRVPGTDGRS